MNCKNIIEYEIEIFRKNDGYGIVDSDEDFKVIKGNIPIMLSAPHSVNQERNGKVKKADIYTGAIVKYLTEMTGCYGIYKIKTKGDPNYYKNNQYKRMVKDIIKKDSIKYFIDIHGLSNKWGVDIDIGTDNGETIDKSIECKIKNKFIGNNLRVIENYPYDGGGNTVTKYVSQVCKIPSIQLEISYKYRQFIKNPEASIHMVKILSELIDELINDIQ